MLRALMALLSTLLTSCFVVAPQINKLPSYSAAVEMQRTGDPVCFYSESTDTTQLPLLIPFATSSATYSSQKIWAARAILKQAEKEARPDVILFAEGGSFYSGSVSTVAFGGGIASGISMPVYSNALGALLLRQAPAAHGLKWDQSGMVISVDESARGSGIFEGDRIVSIAGAPVTLGDQWLLSAHYPRLLACRVGESVQVVWIRPGTGRMEGVLVLQPNPPSHLELEAVDMSPPRPTWGTGAQ